jgi:hypothetical protein
LLIAVFDMRNASVALNANVLAMLITSSVRDSNGTTLLTRPIYFASAALIILPV